MWKRIVIVLAAVLSPLPVWAWPWDCPDETGVRWADFDLVEFAYTGPEVCAPPVGPIVCVQPPSCVDVNGRPIACPDCAVVVTLNCGYPSVQIDRHGGITLLDGDFIFVTIAQNAVNPSVIEFVLQADPAITWWKQITVIDDNTGSSWDIQVNGVPGASNSVQLSSGAVSFKFGKAKWFGRSCRMVYALNSDGRLRGGSRVTFTWQKD